MEPDVTEDDEPATDVVCANCEAAVNYDDEAVLVQIVQPQHIGGRVLYLQVINEDDVEGDFLFTPYVYCFECWDGYFADLKKEAEDAPPVQDPEAIVRCTCCGSGIRAWEYLATFTIGELHVSGREPNNIPGPQFIGTAKPEAICLYCMTVLNDNYISMWDELSQTGECTDCTLARCWRHDNCQCGCHQETDTDEE